MATLTDSGVRKVWVGREAVDGTIANRFHLLHTRSHKFVTKKTYITPKEYGQALVAEYSATQATSHGEFDITFSLRPLDFGWLACSIFGPPTITLLGTGTNNVQTVTGNTGVTAGNWTITIGSYTTANIAYNANAAAVQTAINLLPSVMSTANCTVAGGPINTVTPMTFTFANNLAGINIPMSIDTSGLTNSGAAVSLVNTTPGVGAYQAVYKAGAVGKSPLSFIEFDGTDYRKWLGAHVNTWEISHQTTDSMIVNVKGFCHSEAGTASTQPITYLPSMRTTGYVEPFGPAQYINGINYKNAAFTFSKSGKISGNNQRTPIYAEGLSSVDMVRVAEGFITSDFDMTVRNTGYADTTNSGYSDYNTAADPLNLTITASDATSNIGSTAQHPTVKVDIQNPEMVDGERNITLPEVEVTLKGKALYDGTQATPIQITVISEEKYFADIAA